MKKVLSGVVTLVGAILILKWTGLVHHLVPIIPASLVSDDEFMEYAVPKFNAQMPKHLGQGFVVKGMEQQDNGVVITTELSKFTLEEAKRAGVPERVKEKPQNNPCSNKLVRLFMDRRLTILYVYVDKYAEEIVSRPLTSADCH